VVVAATAAAEAAVVVAADAATKLHKSQLSAHRACPRW
jgi:hypothetical protein